MIRLYFNVGGPLPWSIDKGDPSTERMFQWVGITGAYGVTTYRKGELPSAWIEFGPEHWIELVDSDGALIVRRAE